MSLVNYFYRHPLFSGRTHRWDARVATANNAVTYFKTTHFFFDVLATRTSK